MEYKHLYRPNERGLWYSFCGSKGASVHEVKDTTCPNCLSIYAKESLGNAKEAYGNWRNVVCVSSKCDGGRGKDNEFCYICARALANFKLDWAYDVRTGKVSPVPSTPREPKGFMSELASGELDPLVILTG
jgi:hypothetical protein